MDYELEKQLVEYALAGRWEEVDHILREELSWSELDALSDVLDNNLLSRIDAEAIRRAEKRR